MYFVVPEHLQGSISGFDLDSAVDRHTRHYLVFSSGLSYEQIDNSSLSNKNYQLLLKLLEIQLNLFNNHFNSAKFNYITNL